MNFSFIFNESKSNREETGKCYGSVFHFRSLCLKMVIILAVNMIGYH